MAREPTNLRAKVFLGYAIMHAGYEVGDKYSQPYVDRAMIEWNEVIAKDPKIAIAYRFRAMAYQSMKKYDLALAEAGQGYRIDPNDSNIRYQMGEIYVHTGDLKLAGLWLNAANLVAKTQIDKKRVLRGLMDYNKALKNYPGMVANTKELLDMEPNSPWAMHNHAISLFHNNELDKAIELEHQAIKVMDFGAAHEMLGRMYFKKSLILTSGKPAPDWSKDREAEKLALQAYEEFKDDDVCVQLVKMYWLRAIAEHETDWLDKADLYLEDGRKRFPENKTLVELTDATNKMKAKIIVDMRGRPISGRWPAAYKTAHGM